MNNEYTLRRASSDDDADRLRDFYRTVFEGEDVGQFAYVLFHHQPGLPRKNWFIIEETASHEVVAALVLIPWELDYCGTALRVAEMGIVGTAKAHRKRGLQRMLNDAFDSDIADGAYDFAMIQGIPGFYNQFGYQYAIPLENHINLNLHTIPKGDQTFDIRMATDDDIPWLIEEDEKTHGVYAISARRTVENWRYLLNHSSDTSYGSDFYIIESESQKNAYMRVPREGFGNGLIVSEMSEDVTYDEFASAMQFCCTQAEKNKKPYIRINMHTDSTAAKLAARFGAHSRDAYALQIKIPDTVRFLESIRPVLDRRLQVSTMRGITGVFQISSFKASTYLSIRNGAVESISKDAIGTEKPEFSCTIRDIYLAPFLLGHRSLDEIRHISPDTGAGGTSRVLVEILFPAMKSWIHEQY